MKTPATNSKRSTADTEREEKALGKFQILADKASRVAAKRRKEAGKAYWEGIRERIAQH